MSSIFTFLMGIFSVLIVRALASLCCRKVAFRIIDYDIVVNGDVFFMLSKRILSMMRRRRRRRKAIVGKLAADNPQHLLPLPSLFPPPSLWWWLPHCWPPLHTPSTTSIPTQHPPSQLCCLTYCGITPSPSLLHRFRPIMNE